jgi:hypothetical protein
LIKRFLFLFMFKTLYVSFLLLKLFLLCFWSLFNLFFWNNFGCLYKLLMFSFWIISVCYGNVSFFLIEIAYVFLFELFLFVLEQFLFCFLKFVTFSDWNCLLFSVRIISIFSWAVSVFLF